MIEKSVPVALRSDEFSKTSRFSSALASSTSDAEPPLWRAPAPIASASASVGTQGDTWPIESS